MRIPHIWKRLTSASQPSNYLFFDTETKPNAKRSDDVHEYHELWFGWVIAYRVGKNGISNYIERRFTSIEEFWEIVRSRVYKGTSLFCFAHNLGFDGTQVDILNYPYCNGFAHEFAVIEDPPTFFIFRYNGATVKFIDTFNYWKCSVSEMGVQQGSEKLLMPSYDATQEEWDRYCLQDVKIISNQVKSLYRFVKDNDLGPISISAPSLALKTYKHRFMKHELFVHDNDAALKVERNSYYGGLVKNFFIGKVRANKVYQLDANSLYPYVMLGNFPTKLTNHVFRGSLALLKNVKYSEGVAAKVRIRDYQNTYLIKHAGKLLEPLGNYTTYLCGDELRKAVRENSIQKVYDVCLYEMKPIFKDYIDFFWGMRKKFKASGDKTSEQFCKLMMNSLYGKFGSKGSQWVEVSTASLRILYEIENLPFPKVYEKLTERKLVSLMCSQHRFIDYPDLVPVKEISGKLYMKIGIYENAESLPIVAAYVTMYAREYMRRLISIAGVGNVYYTDTDSIFCNEDGYQHLLKGNHIDNNTLGKLKVEGIYDEVVFHGPKDYQCDSKVVRKGIRKNAKQITETTYEQLQFEGLKSVLKRGGEPYIIIKKIRKTLSRKYDKGKILSSGLVKPLTLNLPERE